MNKKELWLNIANYHFDDLVPTHLWDVIASKFGGVNPFTKAFADKLCRKLDWDKDFALKAVWEYKKFVYLGVVSDFSVTPSKIIDQVWHEHLLFSDGYRTFCHEVIHYKFDHHPELVPIESQLEAFEKQYFATLELYEREFGSEAPEDIWGNTKFDENKNKKRELAETADSGLAVAHDGGTLISMFPEADSSDFEFGGGEFGGGGASGGWWDGSDDNDSDSDSGGDGDSGSSCSSGCGGGCGGD
jgi:hypothetical protein